MGSGNLTQVLGILKCCVLSPPIQDTITWEIFKKDLFYVDLCVLTICVLCLYKCLWRPEEGITSPGTENIGICEMPIVIF